MVPNGSICVFCRTRNVHCTLAANQFDRSIHAPKLPPKGVDAPIKSPSVENSDGPCDIPDQALCDELVGLYFDLIHDKQHILFHRPSFTAAQRRGESPLVLVYSIIALAARSVNPVSTKAAVSLAGARFKLYPSGSRTIHVFEMCIRISEDGHGLRRLAPRSTIARSRSRWCLSRLA